MKKRLIALTVLLISLATTPIQSTCKEKIKLYYRKQLAKTKTLKKELKNNQILYEGILIALEQEVDAKELAYQKKLLEEIREQNKSTTPTKDDPIWVNGEKVSIQELHKDRDHALKNAHALVISQALEQELKYGVED